MTTAVHILGVQRRKNAAVTLFVGPCLRAQTWFVGGDATGAIACGEGKKDGQRHICGAPDGEAQSEHAEPVSATAYQRRADQAQANRDSEGWNKNRQDKRAGRANKKPRQPRAEPISNNRPQGWAGGCRTGHTLRVPPTGQEQRGTPCPPHGLMQENQTAWTEPHRVSRRLFGLRLTHLYSSAPFSAGEGTEGPLGARSKPLSATAPSP